MTLLNIDNLKIEFPTRHGTEIAVNNVSLTIEAGEILGLVGESGAGKSTIGNGIVQLLSPPGRVTGGKVTLNGETISNLQGEAIRSIRGSRIGFIFQDPMTSLNPLFTIENQMVETIVNCLSVNTKEAKRRAIELLEKVGIPEADIRIRQGIKHHTKEDLLIIKDLNLSFITQDAFFKKNQRHIQATKDINLVIKQGETFGLVGESGSGKSTIARMVAGLQQPDSGSIIFDNVELINNPDKSAVKQAHLQLQMIFQNPYSSLNSRMKINDTIAEPILFHKLADKNAVAGIVGDLLDHVGLGRKSGVKYPHEFSGGQ